MATNFHKRARAKGISSCSAACMHGLASHMFMFHFASCRARCSWCMHGLYIACTRPAGSQFLIGLDVPHWKLPALDAMIMFDCVHLFILAS